MVRTGTYIALSSSLRIKIPTHMRKQLKINVFSYFNLVRNFKFSTSLHSSAPVGMLQCDYPLSMPTSWTSHNQMCFRRWSIGMKLVVLISHLLHRYQFLNQFLRGINFHWLVIFQLVVMQPWSTTVFWRYKPVSKRYQKFKEVKWMRITETILFHDHGAWICSMFCFFGCVFIFIFWFATQS